MKQGGRAIPLSFAAGIAILAACVDIPTSSNSLLSFQFDPLPSPSVVVGDSLRDSLGVARPITYKAFNYSGEEVTDAVVHFIAADRGIRVDSIKGFVLGDSVRSAARIIARIKDFTSTVSLAVTTRPDTVVASNAVDSVAYSLIDTLNVSGPIGVKLIHDPHLTDSAVVASYVVSFQIVSQASADLGRLVNDANAVSPLDTTDASGIAARRIRLDVLKLVNPVDSIVVNAIVRYHGAQVRGSPVRLVVRLKPK